MISNLTNGSRPFIQETTGRKLAECVLQFTKKSEDINEMKDIESLLHGAIDISYPLTEFFCKFFVN